MSGLLVTGVLVSVVIGMQEGPSETVAEIVPRSAVVASVSPDTPRTAASVRRAADADAPEVPSLHAPLRTTWAPPAAPEPADAEEETADTGDTPNSDAAAPEPSWSRLSTIAKLLAAVGIGGGAAGPTTPSTPTQQAATTSSSAEGVRNIRFGDSHASVCQSGAETFVINHVREVYVCVSWPVLTGTHDLDLTFISPDGNAYQTTRVPFVTADAAELESTSPDIQRAGVGSGGEARVVAALPVAGTHINRYKMVGVWTVRVSVDGQSPDVDRFTLSPSQ